MEKVIALISLFVFLSCGVSNGNGGDSPFEDKTYSTTRELLIPNGNIELDGTEKCFRFNENSVIPCANDESWDIKFDGWLILTNGGVSGLGNGGGVYYPEQKYEDIGKSHVPAMRFSDAYSSVFYEWYIPEMEITHTLKSRNIIYLIESNNIVYKMQIISYYGTVDGMAVSAYYTIKYKDLTNDGVVITVDEINATAGGSNGDGDASYFSFQDGILDMNDTETDESTEWDISFKRMIISLNSGVNGSSNVKGVRLNSVDFDSISDADIPQENYFEEDRVYPLTEGWCQFEDKTVFFFDAVYMIGSADGQHWYKFYPLIVDNPTTSGYDELSFRFDKIM